MILRSPKSRHFFSFTANGFALRSVSDRRKLKRKSLDTILGVHTGGPNGRRLGEKGHFPQDYLKFKDLLERFLFFFSLFFFLFFLLSFFLSLSLYFTVVIGGDCCLFLSFFDFAPLSLFLLPHLSLSLSFSPPSPPPPQNVILQSFRTCHSS